MVGLRFAMTENVAVLPPLYTRALGKMGHACVLRKNGVTLLGVPPAPGTRARPAPHATRPASSLLTVVIVQQRAGHDHRGGSDGEDSAEDFKQRPRLGGNAFFGNGHEADRRRRRIVADEKVL